MAFKWFNNQGEREGSRGFPRGMIFILDDEDDTATQLSSLGHRSRPAWTGDVAFVRDRSKTTYHSACENPAGCRMSSSTSRTLLLLVHDAAGTTIEAILVSSWTATGSMRRACISCPIALG
jgi:hypothetical protein